MVFSLSNRSTIISGVAEGIGVPDGACELSSEADALSDEDCKSPSEAGVLSDGAGKSPSEADAPSDGACKSPSEADALSDEDCKSPSEADVSAIVSGLSAEASVKAEDFDLWMKAMLIIKLSIRRHSKAVTIRFFSKRMINSVPERIYCGPTEMVMEELCYAIRAIL